MQGSWNNDQAYYRCTYPNEYARTNHVYHPRVVYLREAEILPELDTWLSTSLDPVRLPATIEALAASQDNAIPRELVSLREVIGTCHQKLAQYRAALGSGADPAVVGQWITETQARKLAADARLRAGTGARPGPERMTKEQIAATVTAISDLMQALRDATNEDRAEIYTGLNLQLTYNPGGRIVNVSAGIGQTCTKGVVSEDGLHQIANASWPRTSRLAELPSHAPIQADLQRADARTRKLPRPEPGERRPELMGRDHRARIGMVPRYRSWRASRPWTGVLRGLCSCVGLDVLHNDGDLPGVLERVRERFLHDPVAERSTPAGSGPGGVPSTVKVTGRPAARTCSIRSSRRPT